MKLEKHYETMNPIALAFLGDAVFELYVRNYLVHTLFADLHFNAREIAKEASTYVRASAQFYCLMDLKEKDFFTEEEWALVLRGRNQKPKTVPKNAKVSHYRYATGFEALIGALYMKEDHARIQQIMNEVIAFHDFKENREQEKKGGSGV